MNDSLNFDVVIVGAGPSGSTAARICASQGLKTALLDKHIPPRDKLCGGGVSNRALEWLGLDIPIELVNSEICGAIIQGNRTEIKISLDKRAGILVDRSRFDHFLSKVAEEAGAQSFYGEKVKSVKRIEDGVEITTDKRTFKAGILIGADGINSVCRRLVRSRLPEDEMGNCLEAYIHRPREAVKRVMNRHCVFDFAAANYGYGWIFPHHDKLALGIGGFNKHFSNPHSDMKSFMASEGFDPEEENLKGHLIPAGGTRRAVSAERVILCGDAAGFVDPFLGEGIAYAIASGKLAGENAVRCKNLGTCSAHDLLEYDEACWKMFASDLRWALYLTKILHGIPDKTLNFFISTRPILERFTQIVAGELTYKDFMLWMSARLPYFYLRSFFADDGLRPRSLFGKDFEKSE